MQAIYIHILSVIFLHLWPECEAETVMQNPSDPLLIGENASPLQKYVKHVQSSDTRSTPAMQTIYFMAVLDCRSHTSGVQDKQLLIACIAIDFESCWS